MAADRTTSILTVSQHPEFARPQPLSDGLNHFQSQLRTGSILLPGGLTGLFYFQLSIASGGQFRFFLFAIEADQDRQRPDLFGSEGKRDMQGEDDPVVAKGKEGL